MIFKNYAPDNGQQINNFWILQNRGGERDMNVRGAWEDGYSGLGIVVTILDDGLEKDHPDLIVNYVSQFLCSSALWRRVGRAYAIVYLQNICTYQ